MDTLSELKACSLVSDYKSFQVRYLPSLLPNLMLTCEWELGLVYTQAPVHPIAFYYQPSQTRWWGLVLFSFETALHFTVEPVAFPQHL